MDEFINSSNHEANCIGVKTIKITSSLHKNETSSSNSILESNTSDLVPNAMDTYLKRHKLDLTLLPNKKIKLSDLTHSSNNTSKFQFQSNEELVSGHGLASANQITSEQSEISASSGIDKLIGNNGSISEGDEEEITENEENHDQGITDKPDGIGENNEFHGLSNSHSLEKRSRKKREPSLKLQQKLSNDDLELIVNSVRNRNAKVIIADVKKDNYIDKILKVELLETNTLLSNGKSEALLKKSMFSKELNTLFDTFINALCGQKHLIDEHGNIKPTLSCLVVDCDYKSFSEAEIMRHIKRHLAQDGYTCPTCFHQFASMTNLQRHLRIHAGNVGKEMKCPECDYKASTITHIKRHMAHKHLERALPCPHCSFMGATNAELKIHMARKHLELTGKNPLFLPKYLRKDYQCSICKEQYNDFKEYQGHMYEHTSSSNRFQCTECPYNCKNYSKLKRHMLYHTGARNFSCELCGNKFFQMEHLKRHMQSIHNITSQTTSSSSSVQKVYSQKSTTNKKPKKTYDLQKLVDDGFIRQGPTITTIINEEDASSYLSDRLCLRISSRCMYKCQQCEFSTVKLYNLNEHVFKRHLKNHDTNQMSSDSFLDDMLSFGQYDNDDNAEFSDLDEEQQILNEKNSNGQANNEYHSCSFCTYKTDKKLDLRRHLYNKHSSQSSLPIFLSNDPVFNNPSTRFQCYSCRINLESLNEYMKHMNEKHAIPVYILNLTGEISIQEQLRSKGKAEIINSSVFNESSKQQVKQVTSYNNSLNQRQQLKNFINSSMSLQSRHQQQNNTTVRINPLIFKRQNFVLNKPTVQHQRLKHVSSMPVNSTNHQLINENLMSNQNSHVINPCNASDDNSFMNYPKHVDEVSFGNISMSDTNNQLEIIVNEFQ